MANVIVNSFLRDALTQSGALEPTDACLALPATSMRGLLNMLDDKYPGSKQILTRAAVAIDGDIYTDALTETLRDDSELVFIPAIEGG